MSKDKLDDIKYPDESYSEATLQTTKTVVDIVGSFFPGLGPTISRAIDLNLDSIREKRIRELVDSIKQYLDKMPEEIIKSEEFAEAIKIAFSHYINEASEEKRQLLLNMYKSFMASLPAGRKKTFKIFLIFDDLFRQLSLPSLLALIQFDEHFKGKAKKHQIIQFFGETQEIHYMRCFSELVSQGLLEEEIEYRPFSFNPTPPKVIDDQDRTYKIGPFAAVFLAWLRHKLDNETSSDKDSAQ